MIVPIPAFAKSIALDFIITCQQQIILLEFGKNFGRRGLLKLFPRTYDLYRKRLFQFRRTLPSNAYIARKIGEISSDKISTYKLFTHYQPSSLVFRKYSPRVERWLQSLRSNFVIVKPPRGSCGKGIEVFTPQQFTEHYHCIHLGQPILVQEYIKSKSLHVPPAKGAYVGCIRHVVLLHYDGRYLNFIHLPPYWRIAPEPFVDKANKEALTANISRGAVALPVDANDRLLVHKLSEDLSNRLLAHILNISSLAKGSSSNLDLEIREH